MRDIRDQMEEALEAGRQNQEIIELGACWCQHLRLDRSFAGIGLLEQQTGLPISGGSFACDHARGQSPHGMNLRTVALDFYQRNCKGCPKREPTGVLRNLGTWAEELLAQRARDAEIRQQRELEERRAREARSRRWRLVVSSDAAAQSILELVERLDADGSDKEAATDLVAHVSLHPSSLSDEIITILLEGADECHLSPCLDSLIVLSDTTGAPDPAELLPLAIRAMRECWDSVLARRIVANLAEAGDLAEDNLLVQRAISLAGVIWLPGLGTTTHEPDVLFRFLAVAPSEVEQTLASELRQTASAWNRACAASATEQVIAFDEEMGARLLFPLLEGLKLPDDRRLDCSPRAYIARAVGRLLWHDPKVVDGAVACLWPSADGDHRCALLSCYDLACRGHLDERIPQEAARSIGAQGLERVLDADLDVALAAADLLALLCRYHLADLNPDSSFFERLIGTLAILCDRYSEPSDAHTTQIEVWEQLGRASRLSRCLHDVSAAAAAIVSGSPGCFGPPANKCGTEPKTRCCERN